MMMWWMVLLHHMGKGLVLAVSVSMRREYVHFHKISECNQAKSTIMVWRKNQASTLHIPTMFPGQVFRTKCSYCISSQATQQVFTKLSAPHRVCRHQAAIWNLTFCRRFLQLPLLSRKIVSEQAKKNSNQNKQKKQFPSFSLDHANVALQPPWRLVRRLMQEMKLQPS